MRKTVICETSKTIYCSLQNGQNINFVEEAELYFRKRENL